MKNSNTVISYRVVERERAGDLVGAVNQYIGEGWQPLGPMSFANADKPGSGRRLYVQTMVKYLEPDEMLLPRAIQLVRQWIEQADKDIADLKKWGLTLDQE